MTNLTPVPCCCGGQPIYKEEAGLIDLIICKSCGFEGPAFFDGAWEWLVKGWNHKIAEILTTKEVAGSGI